MPGRRRAEKHEAKPATARGTRTALQGGAGYLVAQLLDTFVELSDSQLALVAVILTALFSWLQTVVEDYSGHALLREVPETDPPVVDA
jgi:cell shape-determining protein MreD